ncbi:SDR family oxidoreductase [Streptomyces sp. 6N223]|uniref:SDR family oxidoreductase n=1 Tax=Streptomyces sp. 6N223 TaxID=3457412 RepID=UPI003FD0C252
MSAVGERSAAAGPVAAAASRPPGAGDLPWTSGGSRASADAAQAGPPTAPERADRGGSAASRTAIAAGARGVAGQAGDAVRPGGSPRPSANGRSRAAATGGGSAARGVAGDAAARAAGEPAPGDADVPHTAIVTGARGGIGRAVVARLVGRGIHVVAVDAAPPPEADADAEADAAVGARGLGVRAYAAADAARHAVPGAPGGRFADAAEPAAGSSARVTAVTAVTGDITDEDTLAAAFNAAPTPVTSLVTCAFTEERASLREVTRDGFARTLDVLLTASWQWGAALRERAAGRPAAIVHVASVQAFGAIEDNGPYASAKAGLVALTRAMAVEWGPDAIRCNALAPAFVAVPRNAGVWQDPARLARIEARYPLRRSPTAEDVAAAACFLLSPDAAAITGVCLPVDGGLLAALP